MTVIQLLSLISALAGATDAVTKVIEDLRAAGHPDSKPIPAQHLATVLKAVASVAAPMNNTEPWKPMGVGSD